jgi:hypothetical protein
VSLPYHLLAISIERIIDDPFSCIESMVIFVTEMPKALSDGYKPWPFRLMIERVVCVGAIDDFSK